MSWNGTSLFAKSCLVVSAFYDSATRRIIMYYEMVAALADGFREDKELTEDGVGE